jgi:alkylation response protein AidB-like acyl-CoA dehydrogenase
MEKGLMRQLRTAVETSPVEELLGRLGELAPLVRQSAAEAERLARLPKPMARALLRFGLFRLWVPKKCAGFELELPEALEVFAAAARLDGSTGWAVMIGSCGGLLASQVDAVIATSVFARPETVIASGMAPEGRAVRVAGGYRVTGCWHYATGAPYATTFLANCMVMDGKALVLGENGRPLTRAVLLEASQVSIVPAWDASGLRGTGSDDFEVRDVFVPEPRSFSLSHPTQRESGALYRLPLQSVTELSITAVALGIVQHALDEFAVLTRNKKVSGMGAPLAADPGVQARYAEARATWGLIKAGVDALARRVWRDALASRNPSHVESSEVAASCALSVVKLRSAVSELIALAGMHALQPDSELARAWRDLQALAAHAAVSPRNLTTIRATLLAASESLTR